MESNLVCTYDADSLDGVWWDGDGGFLDRAHLVGEAGDGTNRFLVYGQFETVKSSIARYNHVSVAIYYV